MDVFRTEKGEKQCHCRCSCGREKDFSEDVLLHGNMVSCGHVREENGKKLHKNLHFVENSCVEFLKRKKRIDNKTGHTGVYRTPYSTYRASITLNKVRHNLGTYPTLAEAIAVREQGFEKYHKPFLDKYEKSERSDKMKSQTKWIGRTLIGIFGIVCACLLFINVLPMQVSAAGVNTTTYTFYDADGQQVASQIVKKGDTLYQPAVPKTLDGKTFTGWVDGSGKAFKEFGKVGDINEDGETIQLHAHYEDAVYLYYHDQYGNLIKSQSVTPKTTVTIDPDSPLVQVQPLTQCQDGWSTTPNGTTDVSGQYKIGTASVNLYPILKEGYWVTFQTNSSMSIARQFISRKATGDDAKVNKPKTDPVKQGYVFDQWYSDPDLKTPYDFSQKVTRPLTLYAGYKPATDTEYTVKYWIEYQKTPGSGVGDGIWDYKMLTQEVIKGTTGDKAGFHTKLIFSSPYNKSSDQYELNTDLTTAKRDDPARPTIAADGSTVLNVYYRCKTYNLSINVPKSDGTTQQLAYKNVKYSSDLTHFWQAVFAIRPEKELFDGKHRFVYSLPNGSIAFVESASQLSTMERENIAMSWQGYGGDNSFYKYYLETLHGKAPAGKTVVKNTSLRGAGDTRTYYLQKEDQFSSGWFGGTDVTAEDFPGFTPAMANSDGHYHLFNDTDAQVWLRYPEAWFNQRNSGANYHVAKNADGTQHMYNGANDPIRLYFTRNSYPLTFHTDGGPELKSQLVLFEDDLSQYKPSNYVVNQTAKTTGNETFVFGGWYTDKQMTRPFDFNGTMPAYELDLYAKWVPQTYTVSFDTGMGSSVDKVTDIEYGRTVAKPEEPTYTGHVFLGWTLDGRPYSFFSGVTKDITLKAEWRSIKAWPVKYNLNGGSGIAPDDRNQYYENAGVTAASAARIQAPEGKVFLGWKCSADGQIYYPNAAVPMAFNGMTLTAQWGDVDKTTSLTYDFNFKTFGIADNGVSSKTVNALKNNSKIDLQDISAFRNAPAGYIFKGWYLDQACTDGPYTKVMVDNLKVNGNRVYAKWERVSTPQKGGQILQPNTPQTGDNLNVALYVLIMAGGVTILAVSLALRKKAKNCK